MIPNCRPLNNEQLLSLCHRYPAITSAIAGAASAGIRDASVLSPIFDANWAILDDIVAAGTGLSADEVKRLGWAKMICAFSILSQTIADQPNRPPLDLAGLQPLIGGNGVLQ